MRHPTYIQGMQTFRRFLALAALCMAAATAMADPFSASTKILGTLQYGETSPLANYSNPARFRAYTFYGKAGDRISASVQSLNGDAILWITDFAFNTLAMNDDANDTTLDAYASIVLPSGTQAVPNRYFIFYREYSLQPAEFRVKLMLLNPLDKQLILLNPTPRPLNYLKPVVDPRMIVP